MTDFFRKLIILLFPFPSYAKTHQFSGVFVRQYNKQKALLSRSRLLPWGDSRKAAQGMQSLVRNAATQKVPDIQVSGVFVSPSAHTGLAPYRSAPLCLFDKLEFTE